MLPHPETTGSTSVVQPIVPPLFPPQGGVGSISNLGAERNGELNLQPGS